MNQEQLMTFRRLQLIRLYPHAFAQAVSLTQTSTTQLLHQHLECANPICACLTPYAGACLPHDTELLGDGTGGLLHAMPQVPPPTGCVFCEPLCVSYKGEDLAPALRGLTSPGWTEAWDAHGGFTGEALHSRLQSY